jgi:hypothetical protein
LNFLYLGVLGVLGDLAVRFLLIIEKLPLQGRGWRSGYVQKAQWLEFTMKWWRK